MEETKAKKKKKKKPKPPGSELQMEALRLLHGTPENTTAHYFHSQFYHLALHIFKEVTPCNNPVKFQATR